MKNLHPFTSALAVLTLWFLGTGMTCTTLSAQNRGSLGQAEFGVSFLDLSALNQTFETEGFPTVRENIFAFGLALNRLGKHWTYGGKMYNYMLATARQDFQLGSVGYHYLILQGGPILYRQEDEWLVHLSAGAGFGIGQLKVRPIGKQFHESHYASGALLDAALHFNHFFSDTGDGHAFQAGLSIGYLYAFDSSYRVTTFGDQENGFPISPQGAYLRLTLGMASWR